MKSFIAILFTYLAISSICNAETNGVLKDLSLALRSNNISQIDILAMSPRTRTVAGLAPKQLEELSDYKVIIRGTVVHDQERLANVLENTEVRNSEHGDDLRWGMIFYDNKAQRVASIYLNRSGEKGTINTKRVSISTAVFKDDLIDWLEENFPLK